MDLCWCSYCIRKMISVMEVVSFTYSWSLYLKLSSDWRPIITLLYILLLISLSIFPAASVKVLGNKKIERGSSSFTRNEFYSVVFEMILLEKAVQISKGIMPSLFLGKTCQYPCREHCRRKSYYHSCFNVGTGELFSGIYNCRRFLNINIVASLFS